MIVKQTKQTTASITKQNLKKNGTSEWEDYEIHTCSD